MKGLQIPAIIQCRWAKMEKNKCFRIGHCKKKSCRLMDATGRTGLQWHPGNRPVVEFNGHNGSLVD